MVVFNLQRSFCIKRILGSLLLLFSVVGLSCLASHSLGRMLISDTETPNTREYDFIFYEGSPTYWLVSQAHLNEALESSLWRRSNSFSIELLNAGASIEPDGPGEIAPMTIAAGTGNLEIMTELLKRGADIDNSKNFLSAYPLAMAVLSDDSRSVEFILQRGANVNRQTRFWGSPIDLARQYELYKMESILIRAGASPGNESKRRPSSKEASILYYNSRASGHRPVFFQPPPLVF